MQTHRTHRSHKESGFTLVELSIVLVIIGLIVGGVLVGQDLIRAAETRAMISQIERFNTAVNTFRVKYNYLPGELRSADAMISGAVVVDPARLDSNGVLSDAKGVPASVPTNFGGEVGVFFNHLSKAGFIKGDYTGLDTAAAHSMATHYPETAAKRGGIYAYGMADGLNYWHIGASTSAAGAAMATAHNLRPEEGYNIDTKLDDGVPGTGTVTARGGSDINSAAEANCVASSAYKLIDTSMICQLRIRMN